MSKAPTIKKRSAWKKFYESYKAYLYLAPAILVMLVFVLYPLVKVFRMGFYTKYNYLTEVGKGFGLKAFEHVLGDPSFQLALKNTLIIFGVGLPISLIIALVIAVLINSKVKFKGRFPNGVFSSVCHLDHCDRYRVPLAVPLGIWLYQLFSEPVRDSGNEVAVGSEAGNLGGYDLLYLERPGL